MDEGQFDALVTARRKAEPNLSYTEAVDEVVANGCEMMLQDSQAIRELCEANRTLGEKIGDFLSDFVQSLREAFGGQAAHSPEAQILMQYAEELQRLWDEGFKAAVANRRAGKKNTATKGGVKYSIDPTFAAEIDSWDGKKDKTFRLGSTSKALQSIGVKDTGIIWRSKKIAEILKKHKGMSKEIIKQVPQILENPVMVLESKDSDTRIVMLGEVYDENGEVVTAVLELQPTTKGGLILDMSVVVSAYGKDDSPQDFITKSGLLYVDPDVKRTKRWMQGLGLQLPSDTTALGSIGNISYQDGEVKIQSIPYAQYMQTVREDVTYTGKVPATKTAGQLAYEKAQREAAERAAKKAAKSQNSVSDSVSDRSLLLEAAEREGAGASEELRRFANRVKDLEGLQRRLERQEKKLAGLREENEQAAEGVGKEITALEGRIAETRELIAKTEERIDRMEKGAKLQREAECNCFLHAPPLNLGASEGAPCRATLISFGTEETIN